MAATVRLICLGGTGFPVANWRSFMAYFSNRGHSCYAIDVSERRLLDSDLRVLSALLPPDFPGNLAQILHAFPTHPAHSPAVAPLVLLSTAATAASAIAWAQVVHSVCGAALLQPSWRQCGQIWMHPPAQPLWLALPQRDLCARLPWRGRGHIVPYRLYGMRRISPHARGWERVAYALRGWLARLPVD